MTPDQKARLLEHDYVSVKGIGVLWRPVDGILRRARFSHGTRFRTQRGEFHIGADGTSATRVNDMWKALRHALWILRQRWQRSPGERRAAKARARFWAEVREGQREAEAHSRP